MLWNETNKMDQKEQFIGIIKFCIIKLFFHFLYVVLIQVHLQVSSKNESKSLNFFV